MKKAFTRKLKKIPLEFHKGCKDCTANCIYNKPVTNSATNSQSSKQKFGCNTSRKKQ